MRNDYRHEVKHRISFPDMLCIRSRLSAIAERDSHTIDGKYFIRSLYFDTPEDKALREKTDGVDRRQKFRIRFYNNDLSFIRLEKKSKLNGLGTKDMAALSVSRVKDILSGKLDWMPEDEEPLIRELYVNMRNDRLAPKTIVDYTREPFTYPAGNVRVTLDYDIRSGISATDFLNPGVPTVPVMDSPVILEVKWDGFLPDIIRRAVQLNVREGAYSKYAECRVFG
ncbi:MAG: polyphosphate polymerase domain-containing protein [Lachnospiraceae bacterium]|nr:polyphosphate polymerase domain-containing protein [Lachnospiraceae bacterium]